MIQLSKHKISLGFRVCLSDGGLGVVNQDITVGGRGGNYFEHREFNQEVSPPKPKNIHMDKTFFKKSSNCEELKTLPE